MGTTKLSIPDEVVVDKIYLIRGQKVMLDRDIAELYGVKPIRLREQVKRNKNRFPGNFMFQLTTDEVNFMVSQNAIPSKKHLGGFLPYVFTEHGLLMLANILKSERAIQMSIRIIEIFVKLREISGTHKELLLQMEKLEKRMLHQDKRIDKHAEEIQLIFDALKQLLNPPQPPRKAIGYRQGNKG